jgi:hypothetical protein
VVAEAGEEGLEVVVEDEVASKRLSFHFEYPITSHYQFDLTVVGPWHSPAIFLKSTEAFDLQRS